MRPPSAKTITAVTAVIAEHLQSLGDQLPTLFSVSVEADRAAGREMFDSVWDYGRILPDTHHVRMLKTEGSSDSLAFVVPVGWVSGLSHSRSLLLGQGRLVDANMADVN